MPPAGLSELSILGGLLTGFASSLHCVGMCGGIASSLMIGLSPDGNAKERARILFLAQMGRIFSYVIVGAILGALGSNLYLGFDRAEAHLLLRWVGAVTLVYIGLSVAGWAPSLAGLDRLAVKVADLLQRPFGKSLSFGGPGFIRPILAGMIWGMLPCGMVYAALFYAMLAGDGWSGGAIMAGFGLGTLPAVSGAALGAGLLVSWAKRPGMRRGIGLAIVFLGVISAALPWQTIAALCGISLDT